MRHTLLALLLGALLSLGAALAQERLVVALGTEATTLDAALATDSNSLSITSHIAEPLLEISPEGELVPALAESYEVSDDGLRVTLTLRQGVTFHDGTPFNAEAAKYNLDRYVASDEPLAFAFLLRGTVTEVNVVDDYTIELVMDEPFAPILTHLTHVAVAMHSPAALEESGEDFGENPVGTGPFRFDSWTRGEHLDLVRNDDYWGEQAGVEALRFIAVPEGTTRIALVETGEAHVAVAVPPQDVPRLEANPDVNVDITPINRTLFVYFNHTMEPFNDVRVRQAINHAVNKEDIVDFVLAGAGEVSTAAIASTVVGYSPVGTYEYNPERARELLAEAGFENGFDMVLHSPTGRYPQDIQISETIQSMLADVGINAQIETLEWSAYLDLIDLPAEENPVQMAMLGWGVATMDADYGLFTLFHTSEHPPAGFNNGFYSNPEVDRLLEEGRVEMDPEARQEIYAELLQLLHDDAAWLFLHVVAVNAAVRDNVEGFFIHPTERYNARQATLR